MATNNSIELIKIYNNLTKEKDEEKDCEKFQNLHTRSTKIEECILIELKSLLVHDQYDSMKKVIEYIKDNEFLLKRFSFKILSSVKFSGNETSLLLLQSNNYMQRFGCYVIFDKLEYRDFELYIKVKKYLPNTLMNSFFFMLSVNFDNEYCHRQDIDNELLYLIFYYYKFLNVDEVQELKFLEYFEEICSVTDFSSEYK